jgi:hypothetical protein
MLFSMSICPLKKSHILKRLISHMTNVNHQQIFIDFGFSIICIITVLDKTISLKHMYAALSIHLQLYEERICDRNVYGLKKVSVHNDENYCARKKTIHRIQLKSKLSCFGVDLL